jgi:hypothetical protein
VNLRVTTKWPDAWKCPLCVYSTTDNSSTHRFVFVCRPLLGKKKLFDPGRCSFLEGDGAGRTRERVCSGRREALERESFSQLRYYFRFSKLRIVMYKNVEIGYRTIGGANNPAGGDLVRLLGPPPVRLINQSTIQSTPDPSPPPPEETMRKWATLFRIPLILICWCN